MFEGRRPIPGGHLLVAAGPCRKSKIAQLDQLAVFEYKNTKRGFVNWQGTNLAGLMSLCIMPKASWK